MIGVHGRYGELLHIREDGGSELHQGFSMKIMWFIYKASHSKFGVV
jgi:hypothetical protein